MEPDLFAGPSHAPTLKGQYVLKDVVLVAAAMVVATGFRGAKICYPTTPTKVTSASTHRVSNDRYEPAQCSFPPVAARGAANGVGSQRRRVAAVSGRSGRKLQRSDHGKSTALVKAQ